MNDMTGVERWLNRRLTKRELLHLIVWVLQPPDEYNAWELGSGDTSKDWILESARHVTAYQNELLEQDRKAGRSGSHVCHYCDEITRKLTE